MLGLPAIPRFASTLALVAGLLASATLSQQLRAADNDSLTLYTVECADPLALDGTPITVEACDTTEDRTFSLVGPDGQETELMTRLEFKLNAPKARAAHWTVNSRDDLDDEGTYTLTEVDATPNQPSIYQCLLTVDGDLIPADLTYVDDGVRLAWSPVVADQDDVAGEALVCTAIARPRDRSDLPMAGIIQIHAGSASPEDGADLIIRDAGDEPYNLRDSAEGSVPSLTYTLTSRAGREIDLSAPESDEGIAVNSFPVPPGSYTLTVDATGTSADVVVEPGQTVLAFNPLEESADAPEDEPADTQDDEVSDPGDETPRVNAVDTFSFSAYDWAGAYPNVSTAVYGRDCVAVYGAGSPNASASLTFDLDRVTAGSSRLVLTGLDDELAGRNPIVITVNGAVVYDDGSPFDNWDPSDSTIPWTEVTVPFDNELLVEGENQVVVTNNSPGGSVGLPPYILLSEARVEVGLTIDAG